MERAWCESLFTSFDRATWQVLCYFNAGALLKCLLGAVFSET